MIIKTKYPQNISDVEKKCYLLAAPIDASPPIVMEIDDPEAIVIFGIAMLCPEPDVLLLSSGSSPQYTPPSSRGSGLQEDSVGKIPNIQYGSLYPLISFASKPSASITITFNTTIGGCNKKK